MSFNINNFLNRGLINGGARPSLFDIEITLPGILYNPGTTEKIRFTARASSIPASTIASVDVPYFGRTIKVNGDRTFADWSVTVMNDEDYTVRNAFEAWHNNINTIVGNRRLFTSVNYKSQASVRHYSKDGLRRIKTYEFYGLFPTSVQEMELDWEATNRIQTFGVTFAYDYWLPANSGAGGNGGLSGSAV